MENILSVVKKIIYKKLKKKPYNKHAEKRKVEAGRHIVCQRKKSINIYVEQTYIYCRYSIYLYSRSVA